MLEYSTEMRRLEDAGTELETRENQLELQFNDVKGRLQSKEADLSSLLRNYETAREKNETVLERVSTKMLSQMLTGQLV